MQLLNTKKPLFQTKMGIKHNSKGYFTENWSWKKLRHRYDTIKTGFYGKALFR